MSVVEKLQERIAGAPRGQAFSAADFLDLGSQAAVAQALKRLTDREELLRLRRGLYIRPRRNPFVGAVFPEPQQVIAELARRRNETVQICGAEAARRLGLSTQMPVVPTYLTSGRSREVRLGNLVVRLRGVSPRKLVLAGRLAGDALAALYYLGAEGVTPEVLHQIAARLPSEEFAALQGALPTMPHWMVEAFQRYLAGTKNG